ncbi:hypothetical protein CHS0354_012328 [Potamilus streckersoni]|uniref:Uncharacterized protein n=1 Tax=Potamilus streckersoni TaxID=2493646 RepID=A0AAE0SJR5_9BIVA|nr:hypothetical protein CHS0354_012328 [Potamilus streckersoni]
MHSEKVSSTASEKSRRSSKPIIEKRRRARINASLTELKTMLMDVIQAEGARHGKLEKADILEMTVRYLRNLERNKYAGVTPSDRGVINEYRIGFTECTNEIGRFLESLETLDMEVKSRLMEHLANSTSNVEQKQDFKSNDSSSRFPDDVKQFTKGYPGSAVLSSNVSPVSSEPEIQTSHSCLPSCLNVPILNSFPMEREKNLSSTIISNNASNRQVLLATELLDKNNNLPNTMHFGNTVSIPIGLSRSHDRVNDTGVPSATLDSGFTACINSSSAVNRNAISGLRIMPVKLQTQNTAVVLSTDLLVAGQVSGCVVPMYTPSAALPLGSCFIQTPSSTEKLQSEIIQPTELPVTLDETSSGANFSMLRNVTFLLPSNITSIPIISRDTETNGQEKITSLLHAQHPAPFSSAHEQKELQPTEHMWRPW